MLAQLTLEGTVDISAVPSLFMKYLLCLFAWCLASVGVPARAQSGGLPKVATVQAQPARLALKPGGEAVLTLRLTIDPKYHVNANPADEGLVPTTVQLEPQSGLTFGTPRYPAAHKRSFAFAAKPISVYEGTVKIMIPVRAGAKARSAKISGAVRYQACNDRSCLLPMPAPFSVQVDIAGAAQASAAGAEPEAAATAAPATASGDADATTLRDRYAVRGLPTIVFIDAAGKERADLRAGEELTAESFKAKLQALASGGAAPENKDSASGWGARLSGASFGWQLVLVFLGGLLLNLTPCVYPMIPITVGYFGNQAEGRASRTFLLAVLYVLGLALVYSILGVSAALTGSLFGSLMQSPWVVGAVAVVLFAFGLSMLGLFTIQPPAWALARGGAKQGALGALAMGALLGIIAAPCVGPAVAALLAYVGAKQDPLLGFALFFVLSLGLGLPYLVLGALGGAAKSMLPRSGAWMVKAKKIFALPILAAAAYFAWTAWNTASTVSAPHEAAWPHATLAVVDGAPAQQRPVVLDFRADWCLPCRKMEKEIFTLEDVKQAAKAANIDLLQVDLTRASG